MKIIVTLSAAAVLASVSMIATLQTASAAAGVCFYNESGDYSEKDGCSEGNVVSPCSAKNPNAKCDIGTKTMCTGSGDYSNIIIVDRSNGFTCPEKF